MTIIMMKITQMDYRIEDSSPTRRVRRAIEKVVVLDLLLVEVPVAVAGSTLEGCTGAFLTRGHEFSTPIDGVTAYVGSMVFPALSVSDPSFLLCHGSIWELLGVFLGPHGVGLEPFSWVFRGWSSMKRPELFLGLLLV